MGVFPVCEPFLNPLCPNDYIALVVLLRNFFVCLFTKDSNPGSHRKEVAPPRFKFYAVLNPQIPNYWCRNSNL